MMGNRATFSVLAVLLFLLMPQLAMALDTASAPYPPDADTNGASPAVVLSWTAGANAAATNGHDVFFGTDYTAVLNGDAGVHIGLQTPTTFDPPGSLTAGVTYYWRVDEVNPNVSPYRWTGAVWSFQVFDGSSMPAGFEAGYALWTANSTTRIDVSTRPGSYPDDPAAAICVAGREYEGFEIGIVPADGRRLDNVRAVLSDLTSGGNTISVSNIDWKVVGLIQSSGSTYVPDILLPMTDFDMLAGNAHAIMVTVHCPADQPAGTYTGTVTIRTDSGLDSTVAVSATVYGFNLPSNVGHSNNSMCFAKDSRTWSAGEFRQYGDFLLAWRMNPDDIYCHNDGSVADLWTISDLEHFYERGMTHFTIAKADNYINGGGIPNLTTWLTSLAGSGYGAALRGMAYFYGYDEKNPPTYGGLETGFDTLRANFSDIRRMTTSRVYVQPWNTPTADMDTYSITSMNVSSAAYNFASGELLRHNSPAYEQWMYHDGENLTSSPFFTRTTFWVQYQQKAEGFLYFAINDWVGAPNPPAVNPANGPFITHTWNGSWAPGLAELIYYGGAAGPIGSLRLMWNRDGIEDYEYLWALSNRIEDIEVGREMAESVAWGQQSNQYTTDYNTLESTREAVAGWMTQAYLAKDPTPDHRSTNNSTSSQLTWEADSGSVTSFDVYFGTSKSAVLNATTLSPEFKGNQAGTTYNPGALVRGSVHYYWRIDEVVGGVKYKGYVWSFTCGRDGLCGYWKFDESAGSTCADASGNGYDGTISGTVNHVPGWVEYGQARTLSNGVEFVRNGNVSIPTGALATLNKQVTVSFWQYGAACQPQYEFTFEAMTAGGEPVIRAMVPADDGTIIWQGGGTPYDDTRVAVSLHQMKNRWNFWTFTKNADTGYMKIFLNGVKLTELGSRTKSFGVASSFRIGARYDGTYPYEGKLDDFRVYDIELSDTDVTSLYTSYGKTGNQGMIGYWKFDEMSGTTAFDLSDNQNNGSVTSASRIAGKVGNGYYFNGSSNLIDVAFSNWDATSMAQGATVMFWAKGDPTLLTHDGTLFQAYGASNVLDVSVRSATKQVVLRAGAYGGETTYTMTDAQFKGEWHHWTFVKYIVPGNGPASYTRIFCDGTQVANKTGDAQAIGTLNSPARIGNSLSYPASYHYHGSIDEVRVYNYPLDNTTVGGIYTAESSAFSGLVGQWKFDENAGTTANDATAFGNNATLTGTAWTTGVSGSALNFNGVDYATVPAASLNKLDKTLTVSMWLYGDPALQPQYNFMADSFNSTSNRYIFNVLSDASNIVYFSAGAGYNTYDQVSKTATSADIKGQWNHWAFTKNAVTGAMKIYLNGALWYSGTKKYRPFDVADSFKIGSYHTNAYNYDGYMDDFRVYNTELQLADVTTIMADGAPRPNPMTFATAPNATGRTSIAMTATTATHPNGVQYYFECTAGGGHSSSWQASASYTDTNLTPNTTYTYRVKARDATNLLETGTSTTQSATTQP